MRTILYSTLLVTFFTLFVPTTPAFAQDCKPVYGGGVTNETICDNGKRVVAPTTEKKKESPTPTSKPKTTPTPIKNGGTTKGGLPVLTPAPQKKTPSTGPELLGLIALVPAAVAGLYLRKKS